MSRVGSWARADRLCEALETIDRYSMDAPTVAVARAALEDK